MEDTSTDSLKCTHYSTILKVRTYGNCFPCECFCYKNKVHEIKQVFFIIYVICQWCSKLTKSSPLRLTILDSSQSEAVWYSVLALLSFISIVSSPTDSWWLLPRWAQQNEKWNILTIQIDVGWTQCEQQVRCFWCVPELTRCFGAVRPQSPSAVDTAVKIPGREGRTLKAKKRLSQKGRHVYLYSCSRNQSLVST